MSPKTMPPGPMTNDESMSTSQANLRTRSWLGVRSPIEKAAAELLADAREGPLGELDLGHVLLVTPGGRAGRRCLEALSAGAKAADRSLVPPRTVTPGNLEFALRGPITRPLANRIEIRLAVMQALQEAPAATRTQLLGPGSNGHDLHAVSDRLISANRDLAMAECTWSQVAEAACGALRADALASAVRCSACGLPVVMDSGTVRGHRLHGMYRGPA